MQPASEQPFEPTDVGEKISTLVAILAAALGSWLVSFCDDDANPWLCALVYFAGVAAVIAVLGSIHSAFDGGDWKEDLRPRQLVKAFLICFLIGPLMFVVAMIFAFLLA